jgi:hypothetical protein
VYLPGDAPPEVIRDTLVWHPNPAFEPLVIDLIARFADVYAAFDP